MSVAYKDGSTWRYPAISYKDGGTWRNLRGVYYKDGSTSRFIVSFMTMMTIGSDGHNFGYSSGLFGAVTNTTEVGSGGGTLTSMYYYDLGGGSLDTTVSISSGSYSGVTQTNYVKLIRIGTTELATSSADLFANNGNTQLVWKWNNDAFSLKPQNGASVAVQWTPA